VDPLCHVSSKDDKETIRVELQLAGSGLSYQPGDALGIYPTNNHKVRLVGGWGGGWGGTGEVHKGGK
jgi:sulfite reductase (NADPH) flavoprotein alpha-component